MQHLYFSFHGMVSLCGLLKYGVYRVTGPMYFVICRLYPTSDQPPRQCLGPTCYLTQFRRCVLVCPYDVWGFVGPKKKTIVGLLVFISLWYRVSCFLCLSSQHTPLPFQSPSPSANHAGWFSDTFCKFLTLDPSSMLNGVCNVHRLRAKRGP
jgi:hypothetical protein